ncbi:MAG TPA: bifunctional glutamate N-acetyltransferase/amino-acid acetyltransferase ArgJ [Methylocystis sp.]|nr:bifunctional glutamate N-acetyltransferase/amino-acid acetyltransferase ArgJ [Methylocystis sp.]
MAKAPAAVSKLAPKRLAEVPAVEGVRLATGAAGVRYRGRTDTLLVLLAEGTQIAGVFTKSKCPSAPVDWCQARLPGKTARALLVNSGNANAFTGKAGRDAAKLSAKLAAEAADISDREVFLASTGVIGEPLDATKFKRVLPKLVKEAKPDSWEEAARAIMTTDTFPKLSTRTAAIDGVETRIAGLAKGAGMIAPDMATMLSFVFTDAPIEADALQTLLSRSVRNSFNAITVDSDTSTSDTLLLFATGAAAERGAPRVEKASDPRLEAFQTALDEVLLDLAHQVVKDGEGARKFIEIAVEGARNARAAKRIALSIANSPLVKTAVAGEDANWGRVVMAVGKAGEEADRDKLAIWFGDVRVAFRGARDPSYDEEVVSALMKQDEIKIKVNIGLADGAAKVWTCDLTKEYVAINGDYRS